MINSSKGKQRWNATRNHFVWDAVIVLLGMFAASAVRFQDFTPAVVFRYLPVLLVASLAVPSFLYGAGLYSTRVRLKKRYRYLLLALCYMAGVLLVLSFGSLDISSRVGRGVLVISLPITFGLLLVHHAFLANLTLGYRERVAMLITGKGDLEVWRRLVALPDSAVNLLGTVDARSAEERLRLSVEASHLGLIEDLDGIVKKHSVDTLLCSGRHLKEERLAGKLREVCFTGVRLSRIVDFLEENYHMVPAWLIDLDWLLGSSSQPQQAYFRKWKRLFDVSVSIAVGLFSLPLLLAGMLWVRLASPGGAIFYRQIRSGRLGRRFEVLKLRTMKMDAEAAGPQWAQHNDPRVIPGGGFLRKFRIDEIPQLLNIFRGEMSFVGPRPERPDFVDELAKSIPYFKERLLVAPGLTGWAQVNYPYGSSVEDARRKLEYDLYYMKHMTLTLDMFVLLDTVRIIVVGGVSKRVKRDAEARESIVIEPDGEELTEAARS